MLDVLIVGSGPAGITAAIYAKRAGLEVTIIEQDYEGTGQIAESSRVDNYPGITGKSGFELGELFLKHVKDLEVEIVEGEVEKLQACPGSWQVFFAREEAETLCSRQAKAIIYCAGATHRRLGVPGEEAFSGKGVSYCAICDGAFYNNKETAVIGGGDTALDDALYLSKICKKVYLLHRRENFRGSAKTLETIRKTNNIEVITGVRVSGIEGDKKAEVLLFDDGRKIWVDGIFIAVGMQPQTELLADLLPLDENGYVIAGETGKTDIPGLFVAGDIRSKALRQVITAAADGANAAVSAAAYIQKLCEKV